MSPEAPWPELRAHIERRLIPLEAWEEGGGPGGSDYDLNPEWRPQGRTRLRPAAVLAPIVERPEGPTVLLTRRAEGMARHAGQVAFPGGRTDPGETPWGAALREAQEEVGLDPGFVTVAGLSDPWETVTGYLVTPVVGFVRPGFDVSPQEAEVAEVFEAPFAFLMNAASWQKQWREQPGTGARRYFYAAAYGERLIWGATAGMLRRLSERLFGPSGSG